MTDFTKLSPEDLRHAPTMAGFPAAFTTDWCGDHKLDEAKL